MGGAGIPSKDKEENGAAGAKGCSSIAVMFCCSFYVFYTQEDSAPTPIVQFPMRPDQKKEPADLQDPQETFGAGGAFKDSKQRFLLRS